MADYNLSATFVGTEALQKAIAQGNALAKSEMAKALNKAANDAQNKAVSYAPKQTGRLKSSIHTEYATENNLVAKVGTDVVYARAQEYGTQGMTINVINGRRTKTGGRTGSYSYTGNIRPKFYMKQALEEIRPNFTNYAQEAARRVVQALSGK